MDEYTETAYKRCLTYTWNAILPTTVAKDVDDGNDGGKGEKDIKERPVGPGMGGEEVVRLSHAEVSQSEDHPSHQYHPEHFQEKEAEQESLDISSHNSPNLVYFLSYRSFRPSDLSAL